MWREAADLNVARSEHSSCAMGNEVYVFCGWDGSQYLSSIECLNVAEQQAAWEIFTVDALTVRNSPVVCPLSDSDFVIMGGYADCNYLSDVIILDKRSRTAEQVLTLEG